MRGALLLDKMELIDERFVTEAGGERAKALRHKRMIVLVAAVLALVIIAAPTVILIANRTPGGKIYSAFYFEEVSADNGTRRYQTIVEPDLSGLKYDSVALPDADRAAVYIRSKERGTGKSVDEDELSSFMDERIDALSDALGSRILLSGYDIIGGSSKSVAAKPNTVTADGKYSILVHQTRYDNIISITSKSDMVCRMQFGGEAVAVDVCQSDEEISEAIEPLRQKLCAAFGEDFHRIRIYRTYNGARDEALDTLRIVIDNEPDEQRYEIDYFIENSYIEILFDNRYLTDGQSAEGIFDKVRKISYYAQRVSDEDLHPVDSVCELISLEEAEELLRKGYVFGGHSCPLCMASQQPVDFEEYDVVRFKYDAGFPFYAFYKKIKDLPNGCVEYARTLVPAVRVVDLEEYFESQEPKHSFYAQFDTTAT